MNLEAYNEALNDVYGEIAQARQIFPPFNSAHEGYAVLLEEVNELWEEIKIKRVNRDAKALRDEARQVAAMAVCLMVEAAE
jgi:hypothetical protein